MHEDTHTGVFTSVSSVAGGFCKLLITKHLLLNINVNGLLTVTTYAAVSAAIGYFVKLGLDWSARAVIKYFNNQEDNNEYGCRVFSFRFVGVWSDPYCKSEKRGGTDHNDVDQTSYS